MRRSLAMMLLACACHQSQAGSAEQSSVPAPRDTVRGTLVIEGSEPGVRPVLRTANGPVALSDAPRSLLGLSRLDLMIVGTHTSPARFRVSSFSVRGFDGRPAHDGTLERAGAAYVLRLADGTTHQLGRAPSGFADLVGQRIWVVNSAEGIVTDFGVIDASPRSPAH